MGRYGGGERFRGARREVLRVLSQGTEAVSVMAAISGNGRFAHVVDGREGTVFRQTCPRVRWGDEPDRLVPLMEAVGLSAEAEEVPEAADAAALALATRVTGARLSPDVLRGPLRAAPVLPLPDDPPQAPDVQSLRMDDPELADAVAAAPTTAGMRSPWSRCGVMRRKPA
ncbi:DUF6461 domain-containing protein [Thermomonospora curvata]|nr:DUF6461 domain-containing protein [Thermomonospora curvata]